MTDNRSELVAAIEQPLPDLPLRPPGHYLMLLLRAAIADDDRGGPWLTIAKALAPTERPVYVWHISVAPVDHYAQNRLTLISGDQALLYAVEEGWPSVTDPTTAELRALGEHAVGLHDGELWSSDYRQWLELYCSPHPDRPTLAAVVESRTRALAQTARRTIAMTWLAAHPEA